MPLTVEGGEDLREFFPRPALMFQQVSNQDPYGQERVGTGVAFVTHPLSHVT